MSDVHDAIAYLEAARPNWKTGESTAEDDEAIQTILEYLKSGEASLDVDYIIRLIELVALAFSEAQAQNGPPTVPHWHSRGALPGSSRDDRDQVRKLLSLVTALGCKLIVELGSEVPSNLLGDGDYLARLDCFVRAAVHLSSSDSSKEPFSLEWGRATVLQTLVSSAAQANTVEGSSSSSGNGSSISNIGKGHSAWSRIASSIGGQSLWELAASVQALNAKGAAGNTDATWLQAIIHAKLCALSDCFAGARGDCFGDHLGSSTRHTSEAGGKPLTDTAVLAVTTTAEGDKEPTKSAPDLACNAILPVLAFLEASHAVGDDASDFYDAGTGCVNTTPSPRDDSASHTMHLKDPLQGLNLEQQQQQQQSVTKAAVKEPYQEISAIQGVPSASSRDAIAEDPVEKDRVEGWYLPDSRLDAATVALEFPWARDRLTRKLANAVLNAAGSKRNISSSCASLGDVRTGGTDNGEANKSKHVAPLLRHQLLPMLLDLRARERNESGCSRRDPSGAANVAAFASLVRIVPTDAWCESTLVKMSANSTPAATSGGSKALSASQEAVGAAAVGEALAMAVALARDYEPGVAALGLSLLLRVVKCATPTVLSLHAAPLTTALRDIFNASPSPDPAAEAAAAEAGVESSGAGNRTAADESSRRLAAKTATARKQRLAVAVVHLSLVVHVRLLAITASSNANSSRYSSSSSSSSSSIDAVARARRALLGAALERAGRARGDVECGALLSACIPLVRQLVPGLELLPAASGLLEVLVGAPLASQSESNPGPVGLIVSGRGTTVQMCGLALLGHALPGLWPLGDVWGDRAVALCLRAACVVDLELDLTKKHHQEEGSGSSSKKSSGLPLNALRALPAGATLLGPKGCVAVRRLALRVGGLGLVLGGPYAAQALSMAQNHGSVRVKTLATEMDAAQAEWQARPG